MPCKKVRADGPSSGEGGVCACACPRIGTFAPRYPPPPLGPRCLLRPCLGPNPPPLRTVTCSLSRVPPPPPTPAPPPRAVLGEKRKTPLAFVKPTSTVRGVTDGGWRVTDGG